MRWGRCNYRITIDRGAEVIESCYYRIHLDKTYTCPHGRGGMPVDVVCGVGVRVGSTREVLVGKGVARPVEMRVGKLVGVSMATFVTSSTPTVACT